MVGALYRAFAAGREVVTADVVEEIRRTTPLFQDSGGDDRRPEGVGAGPGDAGIRGVAELVPDDDRRPGYARSPGIDPTG